MAKKKAMAPGNGSGLNIEADLFKAADTLRGNMDPSEYKHVVLGLIFLRHISHTFEAKHAKLLADSKKRAEDRDEYLAENIFWVPKRARWSLLRDKAREPNIGELIDTAMRAIERENKSLKGVLPKDYSRPNLRSQMLGSLIDQVTNIELTTESNGSEDVLGRVYEYFLAKFANTDGGEYYTPRTVVRLLVEMLEPFKGRVYDPCCGSGGMFVQSEQFVEEHGGHKKDIAIYGQESNRTTWRLAKMNLAVRGIEADIDWNNEGSFHKDAHPDLKSDYILANPPFNDSDWGGERLKDDPRWTFGTPPTGNSNYAWLQHIHYHLRPKKGMAGIVLANGSMSTSATAEVAIREGMVNKDVVDCMVALPGQLFHSTQIPVCLWFLARNKNPKDWRDRRGQTLFIDAREMGEMVTRNRKELSDKEIAKISRTYHAWRGEEKDGTYEDEPGFCKSADLDEIRHHDFVLTPGRYVGMAPAEEDDEPFEDKMRRLSTQLREQQTEARKLDEAIRRNLKSLGFWEDTR